MLAAVILVLVAGRGGCEVHDALNPSIPMSRSLLDAFILHSEDPSPCNSGTIGMYKDPKIILVIPCSQYYWVGGPPKLYYSSPKRNLQGCLLIVSWTPKVCKIIALNP